MKADKKNTQNQEEHRLTSESSSQLEGRIQQSNILNVFHHHTRAESGQRGTNCVHLFVEEEIQARENLVFPETDIREGAGRTGYREAMADNSR